MRVEHEPDNISDCNALKFEVLFNGHWFMMWYCGVKKIPKLKRALFHHQVISLELSHLRRIWYPAVSDFRFAAGVNKLKLGQWGKDDPNNRHNSPIDMWHVIWYVILISQFLPAIHFLHLLRQVLELCDLLAPILVFIGVRAGGRGGPQPPQILGNSDFLGSERKFGQSQFLKTSPFYLIILKTWILTWSRRNNPVTLQWLL